MQLVHQDLDRLLALPLRELCDRTEPEEVGQFVVVDSNDRDVPRHDEPEVACGQDAADRQLVGRREDGSWAIMRDEAPKSVKSQIQGDELRVSSKSRDDLQSTMALLKGKDLEVALQFVNFR